MKAAQGRPDNPDAAGAGRKGAAQRAVVARLYSFDNAAIFANCIMKVQQSKHPGRAPNLLPPSVSSCKNRTAVLHRVLYRTAGNNRCSRPRANNRYRQEVHQVCMPSRGWWQARPQSTCAVFRSAGRQRSRRGLRAAHAPQLGALGKHGDDLGAAPRLPLLLPQHNLCTGQQPGDMGSTLHTKTVLALQNIHSQPRAGGPP